MTPTAYLLAKRLFELGAIETPPNESEPLTADVARDAINAFLCDQAVCSRALVDGKERVMKFADYWSHVYKAKWKYVPHGERGLLRELPGSGA